MVSKKMTKIDRDNTQNPWVPKNEQHSWKDLGADARVNVVQQVVV